MRGREIVYRNLRTAFERPPEACHGAAGPVREDRNVFLASRSPAPGS